MSFRFLHTSDWQLGMTRRFLGVEAQARYDQARFDAVRTLGRLCRERDCGLVVVAGDSFESNLVSPAPAARALEALREFPVSVVLLPGNHDPLDEASVYRSAAFAANRPPLLRILGEEESIHLENAEVEVVGAPWRSKHPTGNPFLETLAALPPAGDSLLRIGIAHGMVDEIAFQGESQSVLPLDSLKLALAENRLHYIALGDRHSFTQVTDRIYYSGTPVATDFNETDPGRVALVELDGPSISVAPFQIGNWRFLPRAAELSGAVDADALCAQLETEPEKENAIIRLTLSAELGLAEEARLRERLEHFSHLFAGLEVRDDDLHLRAEIDPAMADAYSGFVADAARRLAEQASAGSGAAADALSLLRRLAPPDGGGA